MKKIIADGIEERRTLPITFKIRPSYKDKLITEANKQDRTISAVIERALTEYFKIKKV